MGGERGGARGGGKNDQRAKRFRVHPSLDTLKRHRVDVYMCRIYRYIVCILHICHIIFSVT